MREREREKDPLWWIRRSTTWIFIVVSALKIHRPDEHRVMDPSFFFPPSSNFILHHYSINRNETYHECGKKKQEKNDWWLRNVSSEIYIYIVNSILRKLANFRATKTAKAGGNSSGDRFKVAAVKHETATNYIINHIPGELPV